MAVELEKVKTGREVARFNNFKGVLGTITSVRGSLAKSY